LQVSVLHVGLPMHVFIVPEAQVIVPVHVVNPLQVVVPWHDAWPGQVLIEAHEGPLAHVAVPSQVTDPGQVL
jgi:hypothetical protein